MIAAVLPDKIEGRIFFGIEVDLSDGDNICQVDLLHHALAYKGVTQGTMRKV